ncbi:hypothetical protein [uncultured Hyphomicrobium sp.]|uniref:hypothetical protein n=1 Tax=uncultured Hyphomicrobium sp. TaxID=194373 RepID=UPI0025D15024|nr:hypothetical protein [uncultured Hyphomicrobium sp.]
MEHGVVFYMLLGAAVVLVPAVADRLLKGRVADGVRIALGFLAAVLTAVVLVWAAGLLGL